MNGFEHMMKSLGNLLEAIIALVISIASIITFAILRLSIPVGIIVLAIYVAKYLKLI